MRNEGGKDTSMSITCHEGSVERWLFHNPTADVHSFHWHVVRAQCGPDDSSINTNQLMDVVQVVNQEGDPQAVTQVCYIACFPANHAIQPPGKVPAANSTIFPFDITQPYVTHCHVLEHEENDMMSYFAILKSTIPVTMVKAIQLSLKRRRGQQHQHLSY
jgi:FtsP/CotA-like multicopper oxidase with cupredoxin domain